MAKAPTAHRQDDEADDALVATSSDELAADAFREPFELASVVSLLTAACGLMALLGICAWAFLS